MIVVSAEFFTLMLVVSAEAETKIEEREEERNKFLSGEKETSSFPEGEGPA